VLNAERTKTETTEATTVFRDNVRSLTEHHGVRLQVRGLRKGYSGHEVLKGIDFEVNPGEIFRTPRSDSLPVRHRGSALARMARDS